jgi:DNA-binding beta-propeller fold protein YncE
MSPSLQLLLAVICLCSVCNGRVSASSPPIISKIVRGFTIPYKADMPEQMVRDRFDNVYSLDFESNQRIVKLDAEGNLVRVYGGAWYNGVAVDSEGFIYAFSDFITRMDQNGTVLQRYNSTSHGTRGGLAIDCEGNLLVADMQHSRAFRLDRLTGALLNVWTTANPPLSYPWHIAADCAGHVFLADGGRIVELDNGNNIVAFYVNGTGIGVAISTKGDLLVAPGGGYNVAVMAKSPQSMVEAVDT